ncbi:Oidioi.mRNA.OKI2018_I69.PAR.g11045.t1.cds [Oikopleura dioica]|uniref:Oidioi.mRNA.OKI2018_I69.PAR.g11045.t1.cds n=1 Tax=Oikopleura dioica TaxID=34765 RepID=A0ABN7RTS4_OIKDI|nr:Oidioi.mRNA.OKI2018_I69.PAR.g11045.t1.cds [Oikopleura dioica]
MKGLIFLALSFGGARAQNTRLSSFPRGFDRACLAKPCDDATFFKFFPVDFTSEDNTNVMLHAQYQVCVDFIENLKGGCPEVTKMITQYPELVNVIIRLSSSPGVSQCGSKMH